MKSVLLTLGTLVAVSGCIHNGWGWGGFGSSVVAGAGQTVGAFLAQLVLGFVPVI